MPQRGITIDDARAAKLIIQSDDQLMNYAMAVGISRYQGEYCVKVNLDRQPAKHVFAAFPHSVETAGGKVSIIYDITGRVVAADYVGVGGHDDLNW